MPYQKVTRESYGGRIVNSLKGVAVGIVLLIIGTALLFWNEGRAVRMSDTIGEARNAVAEMADITRIDPAYDGKLIYATGRAETEDVVTDPLTGASVSAVSLTRKVEYYQWVETSRSQSRDKVGGGKETVTTYDYNLKWVSSPVDSSGFEVPSGHQNTTIVQIDSETLTAPNVTFGAYRIPEFMKASIGTEESLAPEIDSDKLAALSSQATVSGGTVYIGESLSSPKVGDARITYTRRNPGEISLIAVVRGDTFAEFTSSNGTGFWLLDNGVSTAEAMFSGAEKGNSALSWILRGVGTVLVMLGLGLIFAPLKAVAMVLPFVGNIVGAGTGFIAFMLGFAWSFIVIAIAWVRYRPVLGIGLLAAALLLIILLILRGRKRKARLAAEQPPQAVTQPYQAAAPPPQQAVTQPQQATGRRFCPNCGTPQNPGTKFCPNCGADVR